MLSHRKLREYCVSTSYTLPCIQFTPINDENSSVSIKYNIGSNCLERGTLVKSYWLDR